MRFAALWLLILTACAGPSPWVNFVPSGSTGLTRSELNRLGEESSAFSPFSVALIADPQGLPGYFRLVAESVNDREDIDFSLILGDLTDRSLRTEFLWVAQVVEAARRPMLTVVGNHDGLIYGESVYKEVFGDLNYSFVFRGIKFIMWNNNPFEWGYPDFAWLEAEIASFPYVVIVAHQPTGHIERFPEANDQLRSLYEHPHVLGSLHGHNHKFAFDTASGKPVITVGWVEDTTYGIMRVDAGRALRFERCRGRYCEPFQQ